MGQKTPIAARILGIAESHLHYLVRSHKIPAPQKDSSGDFIWFDTDIERARQALKIDRRRKLEVVDTA